MEQRYRSPRRDSLESRYIELYSDIFGALPKHVEAIDDDNLSDMVVELEDFENFGSFQSVIDREKVDIEHGNLMDKYAEEDESMKTEPHVDDFYDTMDFDKEKAKLRDFDPKLESLIRKLVQEQINDHSKSLGLAPSNFSLKHSSNKALFDIFYTRFPNQRAMLDQKNIMKALEDAYQAGKTAQ